jgi:hypothetical protein
VCMGIMCMCVCLSFYVSSEEDVCSSVGEEGEESELLWRIVLWNWSTCRFVSITDFHGGLCLLNQRVWSISYSISYSV